MGIVNKIKRKMKKDDFSDRNIVIAHECDIQNSEIQEYCNIAHHASLMNCFLDKRTSIGRYSKVRDASLGKYCSVSWDVTIGAVSHPSTHISSHAFTYRRQFGIVDQDFNIEQKHTNIGNDVWIGCNSVIISGVKVGDGAVIGAGAVVTKDVPAYSIVAGVPAKVIKYRFDPKFIERLMILKWWEFPDDIIQKNIDIFKQELTEEGLEILERIKVEEEK